MKSIKGRFFFLFISFILVSCSKEADKAPTSTGGGNEVLSKIIYPHSAVFKTTNEHGLTYYDDNQSCKGCHDQGAGSGLTATKATSCVTCHKIFPHSPEFKSKEHGLAFLDDKSKCTQCHGNFFQGGKVAPSCKTCHTYPHDEGAWALPKKHGAKYNEIFGAPNSEKKGACFTCHAEDSHLATIKSQHFVSCGSCHVTVPHSYEFKNPDLTTGRKPEHAVLASKFSGDCLACHTNLNRLMPTMGVSGCRTCHGPPWNPKNSVPKVKWLSDKDEKSMDEYIKARRGNSSSINKKTDRKVASPKQ